MKCLLITTSINSIKDTIKSHSVPVPWRLYQMTDEPLWSVSQNIFLSQCKFRDDSSVCHSWSATPETFIRFCTSLVYFNACAKFWGILLHEDPRKMYFQEPWSTFMKHALLLQGPLFTAGIILCMGMANGRWCYIVTSSLIGCAHTQIDHSVNGHSQWETMLYCNILSHWLCPYTNWSFCVWA